MPEKGLQVAVVGGGICGLAAAHRIRELHPDWNLTLLEASDRVGGILRTEKHDGYLIEHSADMFTTREPWALALCQRLGIESELIGTNEALRRAFVVRNGKLYRIPEGFTLLAPKKLGAILKSPLLSMHGKARLMMEYFIAPRTVREDECFSNFAIRRFGKETFERLLQPLVAGIYTADPDLLSMDACLSEYAEMERAHGGVLRAIQAQRKRTKATVQSDSGARYGSFLTPRDGMERIVQRLTEEIGHNRIRLRWPAEELHAQPDGKWKIRKRGEEDVAIFDAVILAATAKQSAALLSEISAHSAEELGAIEHAGASIVVAGYKKSDLGHKLDGFGYVSPRVEKRRVLAGSFASVKFAGRAPVDQVLLRFFVGGALQPQMIDVDDRELVEIVRDEIRELLRASGEAIFTKVIRWRGRMPQYHVGHLARVHRIEAGIAKLPRLELACNALRGVGIPFCIRAGELAAERLSEKMKSIGDDFEFTPRKPR